MDMEEANPPEKFHGFRNMEELVVSAALQKMNPEVAVDIIKMANSLTLLTEDDIAMGPCKRRRAGVGAATPLIIRIGKIGASRQPASRRRTPRGDAIFAGRSTPGGCP